MGLKRERELSSSTLMFSLRTDKTYRMDRGDYGHRIPTFR